MILILNRIENKKLLWLKRIENRSRNTFPAWKDADKYVLVNSILYPDKQIFCIQRVILQLFLVDSKFFMDY